MSQALYTHVRIDPRAAWMDGQTNLRRGRACGRRPCTRRARRCWARSWGSWPQRQRCVLFAPPWSGRRRPAAERPRGSVTSCSSFREQQQRRLKISLSQATPFWGQKRAQRRANHGELGNLRVWMWTTADEAKGACVSCGADGGTNDRAFLKCVSTACSPVVVVEEPFLLFVCEINYFELTLWGNEIKGSD